MLVKLSKFIDDDHLVRASSKMAWGGTRIDKLFSTGNYARQPIWVGLVETGW